MIVEDEYNTDLKEIEKEMGSSRENGKHLVSDWLEYLSDIIDLGIEMKNIIDNGTLKEKKDMMSRFRSNLIWNEENLSICKASWLKRYIKGRKQVLSQYPWFEPKNNQVNKGKTLI